MRNISKTRVFHSSLIGKNFEDMYVPCGIFLQDIEWQLYYVTISDQIIITNSSMVNICYHVMKKAITVKYSYQTHICIYRSGVAR